ncbi:MAG: hypothetical protein K5821_15350 [Nitrobacter sp.]|uniref:hypothetical protein n=1 Tax=Nitrobacter sp. TaxID=29420 RepID=UPI0026325DAE|nr:hypothetical protein [Nitrobacter sp.]MCV0387760.1 hypothetical protein [Nitrobacter sp.]
MRSQNFDLGMLLRAAIALIAITASAMLASELAANSVVNEWIAGAMVFGVTMVAVWWHYRCAPVWSRPGDPKR